MGHVFNALMLWELRGKSQKIFEEKISLINAEKMLWDKHVENRAAANDYMRLFLVSAAPNTWALLLFFPLVNSIYFRSQVPTSKKLGYEMFIKKLQFCINMLISIHDALFTLIKYVFTIIPKLLSTRPKSPPQGSILLVCGDMKTVKKFWQCVLQKINAQPSRTLFHPCLVKKKYVGKTV